MFPAHFNGKRYFNPSGDRARGLRDVLRWKISSRPEPSRFLDDVHPVKPPKRSDALRITMVNHATVLLQFDGVNFLTDPVWSERASPFSFAGPARLRAAGVRLEDLPPIDAILLSHNHYDHLDLASLRRIPAQQMVSPLGAFPGGTCELDWGMSVEICGVRIWCVPAQHFSARWLNDRDRTLWCGFWIEASGGAVFFAGDTGFGPHFEWIRNSLGSPAVALLPIGAFLPRWFMRAVHMDPGDALKAHAVLGARTSIAIHHGTFQLADDAPDTAASLLRQARTTQDFRILANGESVLIDNR